MKSRPVVVRLAFPNIVGVTNAWISTKIGRVPSIATTIAEPVAPSRRSSKKICEGLASLDFNRVSLIMAVLEKRAGLLLQNQDAYLKAAGGVKLNEPAIDLAIAVSIASSPISPMKHSVGCVPFSL